ncbi:chromate efflux transporter [Marilutibacter chinensis]|uniref:Chromate efflux transporter n=1 Tax=Marilutibacter chinensis TaxID=2912247 RepID=A0ABS9HTI4_9GAMM|nr:chromate efflux transporter [Lysobacter chinensis]MCF7222013.1 chromate efflux transporter [Lysobacter chinensis]
MPPSFSDAFLVWLRIGLASFGGPAGQIALMHRVLVEERKWIDESRFLHALNYCMLLPGPEAQQLATYAGWLLHGTRGGLVAGMLFVLPGFLLMVFIAAVYVSFGELDWVRGLLFGMQAATLAIVVEAVIRIGRKALRHRLLWGIAAASFVAIFAFGVPFPAVVLGAGLAGFAGARWRPEVFVPVRPDDGADPLPGPRGGAGWTLRVLLGGVALWGVPVLLLVAVLGTGHVFADEAVFFSKMAVVTFGGAYAVLAYMTQQAVERYGWLGPTEMVQGLALAETTPGPLILVITFVGFLGAHGDPGGLDPLLSGLLGATLSTWVTFVPCFLWIFLGAPHIERLRSQRLLSAALTGITAAVVGVILNLSLWFAIHVLFADVGRWQAAGLDLPWPRPTSLDPAALALGAFALLAMLRFHVGLLKTLAACAVMGLLLKTVF